MDVSTTAAEFNGGRVWLQLSDGRTLGLLLICFPTLQGTISAQLTEFELSPRGIHWESLNEDLSLEGLLTAKSLAIKI